MPALKLNAEDLWEVTEATAFITNKAMSRARFLEVMRSALVQVGVDFTQAQSATYNKLRRFRRWRTSWNSPTLTCSRWATGQNCHLGAAETLPPRNPRLHADGVHYAGSRVLRSLQVKQRCVDRLFALYQKKRQELAMTAEGVLCRDAWQWAEVAALHQALPEDLTPLAKTESLGDIEVAPGALDGVEARAPPPPAELPVEDASSSSLDTSTDNSSSASDESADGQDLCGVVADDSEPDELGWLRQGKKLHIIREEVEGQAVSWCRDFAYQQDLLSVAVGSP